MTAVVARTTRDVLTVTGKTMAENLADIAPPDPDGAIIHAMNDPIHKTGGLTILRGSLAPEGVDFLRAVERVLAAEGGRPHWGKYFDESLYDWSARYPRWASFRGVRAALDPHRRFENTFTAALFA